MTQPGTEHEGLELRELVAKALWDGEIAEARLKRAIPPDAEYAQWPEDSIKQPYCQSTYRLADAVLAALSGAREQPGEAKPTLPVGVSVLITNGDLILLGERINNTASGLLSTPGGRLEQNEDIFTCAVRETLEETGLSLTKDLLKVIAWKEHFRFGQHYIMFYVHAPQSFGRIENREPDKCKAWGWRTINELRAEETTEPLDVLAALAGTAASAAPEKLQVSDDERAAAWIEKYDKADDNFFACSDLAAQFAEVRVESRLKCDSCGQDISGPEFAPHLSVYCHKPGCDRETALREKLGKVLGEHWLTGIHCHHAISPDDSTYDWASCACSKVNFPHVGTVGEAVGTWIEHVLAQLLAEEQSKS